MYKVVIDPGHGGSSYGAAGHGLVEKELVLEMALQLEKTLAGYENVTAVLTRRGDYGVSFADRAVMAKGADLLVSLHFNGFHDPAANGFETFVWNGKLLQGTIDAQKTVHRAIYGYLMGHNIRNRGKKRANFAILRMPPTSCVLIEYLFLTNRREADIAREKENRDKMVAHTAKGIAEHLGLKKKAPVEEEGPEEVNYRVAVTSKKTKEAAAKELETVQAMFPTHSPFIVYNEARPDDFWYRIILAELAHRNQAEAVRDAATAKDLSAWILTDWDDLDFPEETPPEEEKPEDIPEDLQGLKRLLQAILDNWDKFVQFINKITG